jgi:hypothetical protein
LSAPNTPARGDCNRKATQIPSSNDDFPLALGALKRFKPGPGRNSARRKQRKSWRTSESSMGKYPVFSVQ